MSSYTYIRITIIIYIYTYLAQVYTYLTQATKPNVGSGSEDGEQLRFALGFGA